MADTFDPPLDPRDDTAWDTPDAPFGYQEMEAIRQSLHVCGYLIGHIDLGGDERSMTITTPGTYQPVNGARSVDHNGNEDGGLTLEAVIFSYSSNAGTSVTVRVRNTTDGSNAGTTAARTDTTVQRDVVTLTLVAGIKTYRLEWNASNTTNPVFAWGYLRLRKVPTL